MRGDARFLCNKQLSVGVCSVVDVVECLFSAVLRLVNSAPRLDCAVRRSAGKQRRVNSVGLYYTNENCTVR